MAISRITILKDGTRKLLSSDQSEVMTFEELRHCVLRGQIIRHVFKYQEAQLLTYRIELIPKPFLMAFLIRLLGRRACYFKDVDGCQQTITVQFLVKLFTQLMKDYLRKFILIRRNFIEVKKLSNECATNKLDKKFIDLSGVPVYLRTDFVFGLCSGGSLGHIAGVLNHLDEFTGKPVFLSTDIIPAVKNDLETCITLPKKEFWDFKELPSIYFNETFEGSAQRYLKDRKLSFIYQRYSINNYSGLKLARFYGVPFVLEYNGSEIWIQQHWGKPLKYAELSERVELLNLRAADMIVVVSRPMRDELIGRGIEATKILVNPNGVDPNRYSPNVDGSGVRHQYHFNGNTVIGFIGTFGKWHGAEVLAEAFGQLLHKHPEYEERVKLFMIGDGTTMPVVKQTIEKLAIKKRCLLTGLIPQEEGPEYLAACDILVASHKPNPDGTPFFGSPTKLFEYMAMGKGIVASDLDQIGEVLKHDDTAWLVKPGDADSLMMGLKTLLDDRERRERLGKAARQEVVAKYTWKEHTRKIIDKLKERCGR